MPTTALTDANNQNRRMFSYDEMVMASDGTRFYIKYLDGPTPNQPPKPATVTQQRAQTAAAARQTASRTVVQKATALPTPTLTTTLQQPAAKRQRVAANPAPSQIAAPQHVQCGICLQKFKNMPSLNFHIEKTHKDTDGPVDCPCGKRFANKKYMKRHQKRRFETERIICGRESNAGTNAVKSGFRVNYQNL